MVMNISPFCATQSKHPQGCAEGLKEYGGRAEDVAFVCHPNLVQNPCRNQCRNLRPTSRTCFGALQKSGKISKFSVHFTGCHHNPAGHPRQAWHAAPYSCVFSLRQWEGGPSTQAEGSLFSDQQGGCANVLHVGRSPVQLSAAFPMITKTDSTG